jgi:hypothetical protein
MPVTKWGTEFLVNTTTHSEQDEPAITALDNGRFVVTWTDVSQSGGDTQGTGVRGQVFNADGSKLGSEFLVNTATDANQRTPAVTSLPDGRFVAVWVNDFKSVSGQIFNRDGAKSGDEIDIAPPSRMAGDLGVAALPDGTFIVSWTEQNALGVDAVDPVARAFASAGTPLSSKFLLSTGTAGHQFSPAIAAFGDRKFAAVWVENTAEQSSIKLQLFANGIKVGVEIPVTSTNGATNSDPQIAVLGDGRLVVLWTVDKGTENEIRGQLLNSDGSPLGNDFRVNTSLGDEAAFRPEITALADGRFVVTWEDRKNGLDKDGDAIHAQVFNADGTKSGSEFLINTTTKGSQERPAITALADGRFVVAWADGSQSGGDTSGRAIRAQIFDPREKGVNLTGTGRDDDLVGTRFADTMAGGKGDDRLAGMEGSDTLDGGDGDDVLDGGAAADAMIGGSGDDTYIVDNVRDTVIEKTGEGFDTVISSINFKLGANVENLALVGPGQVGKGGSATKGTGNGLDNFIRGSDGKTVLKGQAGDDTLAGGLGRDFLVGGKDADRFFFDTALGKGNVDRITDFKAGNDRIVLEAGIFSGLELGALDKDAFRKIDKKNPKVKDADDRILYAKKTGALFYDEDGKGGAKAVKFAVIEDGPDKVSHKDFLIEI